MTDTSTASRLRLVRRVAWAVCAAVALVFAGALVWRAVAPEGMPEPTQIGEADIRSEFSLVDHTGRRVTEADYAGKWQLVFFGFTHCPDICPTTLAYMASVLDELGDEAGRVAPLFITVDPARDTVPVMAEYVSAFHPRLVGLTGTEAEVAAAMEAFKTWAERVDDPAAPDGYSMSHAGHIYLMGPDGRFVDVFQERDQPPEAMASEILDRMGSEDS
ncbi:MAG TPA: SCO family protein [Paracoccaceae bacterium]|nr:SCO family protein [Paracoccaceae bacterium]